MKYSIDMEINNKQQYMKNILGTYLIPRIYIPFLDCEMEDVLNELRKYTILIEDQRIDWVSDEWR